MLPHLHRHALESIVGFSDLHGLAAASQVSREWSAATLSMACLHASFTPTSARQLHRLGQSRLRIHVTVFNPGTFSSTSRQFQALVAQLVNVTDLTVSFTPLTHAHAVVFPAKLRRINATFNYGRPKYLNAALAKLGALVHLESITLEFKTDDATLLNALDFTPFHSIATLRELWMEPLTWNNEYPPWTSVQLDQVRAMPHLSVVGLGCLARVDLAHLLRRPHHLRWQELNYLPNVTDAVGDQLASLPLTKLGLPPCMIARTASLRFLAPLADSLQELHINFEPSLATPAEVETAFSGCVKLQTLSVLESKLTSDSMALILPRLRLLRDLRLTKMPLIDSLAFLSAADCPMLTALSLTKLRVPSASFSHLSAQYRLQSLQIHSTLSSEEVTTWRRCQPTPDLLPKWLTLAHIIPDEER